VHYPLLNCGVFSATADAPHWGAWQRYLGNIIAKHKTYYFASEQIALNAAIIQDRLVTALLPSRCNWMCNRAIPRSINGGTILVEPNPPFVPLGIIHLTA